LNKAAGVHLTIGLVLKPLYSARRNEIVFAPNQALKLEASKPTITAGISGDLERVRRRRWRLPAGRGGEDGKISIKFWVAVRGELNGRQRR